MIRKLRIRGLLSFFCELDFEWEWLFGCVLGWVAEFRLVGLGVCVSFLVNRNFQKCVNYFVIGLGLEFRRRMENGLGSESRMIFWETFVFLSLFRWGGQGLAIGWRWVFIYLSFFSFCETGSKWRVGGFVFGGEGQVGEMCLVFFIIRVRFVVYN